MEYDARAHRLDTLATFAFWVQSKTLPETLYQMLLIDPRHAETSGKPQDPIATS